YGRLAEWAAAAEKTAAANKDNVLAQRVARVRAEIAKSDNDPFIKGWFATNYATVMDANGSNFRSGVINAKKAEGLSDPLAWNILYSEGTWFRNYAPADQRHRTVEIFDMLRKRFPKNLPAAYYF